MSGPWAGRLCSTYDGSVISKNGPKSWKDFFDTAGFPGKRGLRKGPKFNLEFALYADGVPAKDIYSLLATKKGVERAFAKLGTIKKDIIWWETGAQPQQLLAAGEVLMTAAYSGRDREASMQAKARISRSSGPAACMRWTAGLS